MFSISIKILVAYFKGPDKYHSSYSIRVKKKNISDLVEELKQNNSNDLFDPNEQDALSQFSSLLRINETVSKVRNKSFLLLKFKLNRDGKKFEFLGSAFCVCDL